MKKISLNKKLLTMILAGTITLIGCTETVNSNSETLPDTRETIETEIEEPIIITELVAKDQINIRKQPNEESNIITTVSEGTVLKGISQDGEWYKILYNDEEAYVNNEYVYEAVTKEGINKETTHYKRDVLEIEKKNYVEATTTVNIRSDATEKSNILSQLGEGQRLEAVRLLNNGWYEVRYNNDLAYIKSDYVKETSEENIVTPFNKLVMFDNEANIYDYNDKETVIDTVPTYEVAEVYNEENDMYLAEVNNRLCYVNKNDTTELPKKVVIVDISDQNAKLYDGNNVIVDTNIVSGKQSTPSDIGYFDIDWKERNTNLTGPGYSSYVDYWMPFNGGEGLHDAEYHTDYDEDGNYVRDHGWRSNGEFGGDTYQYNGSHGCINLPNEAAKNIYDNVETGTMVLVKK